MFRVSCSTVFNVWGIADYIELISTGAFLILTVAGEIWGRVRSDGQRRWSAENLCGLILNRVKHFWHVRPGFREKSWPSSAACGETQPADKSSLQRSGSDFLISFLSERSRQHGYCCYYCYYYRKRVCKGRLGRIYLSGVCDVHPVEIVCLFFSGKNIIKVYK